MDAVQTTPRYGSAGGNDATDAFTRGFGWVNLAVLAVFVLQTFLIHGLPALPSPTEVFAGDASPLAWLMLALYPGAIIGAIWWVRSTPLIGLREDSDRIHGVNLYLIRAAFFGVLFVGVVDAAISFLRVEDLLAGVVGEQMAGDMGRAAWRGPWIHLPLVALGFAVALVSRTLGFTWLALLIVGAELLIVLTRFVFSYEQAFMGDLVRFWYAALFLFASAYTLYEEGHVRVDVLFASMSDRARGRVNALGSVFLGMTLCWVILVLSMGGRATVVTGAVANFETSQSTTGMYVKYLMAAYLGVFAVTMLIQFVSYLMDAVADLKGQPGARSRASSAAH
jgi:TRAP-type mannitol/chloroaromatic compound transport system permease small subunit